MTQPVDINPTPTIFGRPVVKATPEEAAELEKAGDWKLGPMEPIRCVLVINKKVAGVHFFATMAEFVAFRLGAYLAVEPFLPNTFSSVFVIREEELSGFETLPTCQEFCATARRAFAAAK